MLCDGRMVCGCADPYGKRVLGDARHDTVAGIWTGETASAPAARSQRRRLDVLRRLPAEAAAEARTSRRRSATRWMPARCRRGCTSSARPPATSRASRPAARRKPASRARARRACSTSICSRRVVDEAGPSLGRIDFFNYGEAFLHKRAVEMCEYIKTTFPHIYLYTSTNGLAFTEEQARRLVHSGIDEVTFSIDGATPESYVQYRQRGDFDKAHRNLRADGRREARGPAATCRSSTGATSCSTGTTATRRWLRARRLAADIGVDRLCWEITDHPENAFSRRFVPGTPALRGDSARNLGRQQSRQRDSRRDAARAASTSGRLAAAVCRSSRAPGRPLQRRTRVRNLSTRPFPAQASYGRRLVRLGAQLCDGRRRRSSNRDYRAGLAARTTLEPGGERRRPDRRSRRPTRRAATR